jgi:eukaryotic-like serine/threonine-protein kinase
MVESVADAAEVVMEEELFFDDPPRESVVQRQELVREGEVLAGKYRVERIPGRNGLGVLVQVRHLELGQEVTLKFLVPDACMYPEFVQRFIREARAAVKIQGEHVARVTDVGRLESGAPYMVREFLRGPDLADVLKVRGALPVAEACDYIIQAAEAVAEGHVHGIAHRNLRPTTLVVTRRSDGAPLVKVFDFAAAEALHVEPFAKRSAGLVGTSALLESLPYLSPEQVRDPHNVDFRADVYGLGAILYELLSGVPPFEAESAPALLAMVAADMPVRLRTLRFGLPAALEEAVMRCLEKSREQRFASMSELSAALRPFASADSHASIERIARLARRSARPPSVAETRVPAPAMPVVPPPAVNGASLGFDDAPTTVRPMTFVDPPPRTTLPLHSYPSQPRPARDLPREVPVEAAPPPPRVPSVPPPLQPQREVSRPPPLKAQPVVPVAAPAPAPVEELAPVEAAPEEEEEELSPVPPQVTAAPSTAKSTIMPPPTRARSSISWGSSNSWGPPAPEPTKLPVKRLAALGGAAAVVSLLAIVAFRGGSQAVHTAAAQPAAATVAPPPSAAPPAPVEEPAAATSAALVTSATAPASAAVASAAAPAPAVPAAAAPTVAAPVAAAPVAAAPVAAAPVAAAPVVAPVAPKPAPAAAPVAAPRPAAPVRAAAPAKPAAVDDAPRSPAKVAAAAPSKAKDLFSDPD